MWREYASNHPSLGVWVQRFDRQPRWAVRLGIFATIVVFVVPLVLLALSALLVGAVVFIAVSLLVTIISAPLALLRRTRVTPDADDGRRNVRVIVREDLEQG